jgi:hypothetical protein
MPTFVAPNSKATLINRKLSNLYRETSNLHAKLAEINFAYSEQISNVMSAASLDALVISSTKIHEIVEELAKTEREIKESIEQLHKVDEYYSDFVGDYMLCVKVDRMSLDELEELLVEHENRCNKPKHSCEFGELVRERLAELVSQRGN